MCDKIYGDLDEALSVKIELELNSFIKDKPELYEKITTQQKEQWQKNIKKEIMAHLEDSDIFYDTEPEGIEL